MAHIFDRLVGRPQLARAGWRVSEKRLSPRPNEDRDRELTRLHDEEGLTYPEIARLKQMKAATIARAVQRYRKRHDN